MGRPPRHATTATVATARPAPGRVHPLAALAAALLAAVEGELNRLDHERRFGPHGVSPSCEGGTVSERVDEDGQDQGEDHATGGRFSLVLQGGRE